MITRGRAHRAGVLSAVSHAPPSDPLFSSVLILDHCNATNEPVKPVSGFTGIGAFDRVAADTAQKKWGTASYHNTGAQFWQFGKISAADSFAFNCGAADWCWEEWVYIEDLSAASMIVTWGLNENDSHRQHFYINTDGSLHYYVGGGLASGATAERIIGAAGTVVTGVWTFVQLCKINGFTKIYQDGVQRGSTFTDGNTYDLVRLIISQDNFNGSEMLRGYWDDMRFTRNATPGALAAREGVVPTGPFPDS